VIEIKNITKIIGRKLLCGRTIAAAGEYNDVTHPAHSEYYQFVISNVNGCNQDLDGYQTIVLRKIPGCPSYQQIAGVTDKYEMFNMGLQARTYQYLSKVEIQNLSSVLSYLDKVMEQTKEYYKYK